MNDNINVANHLAVLKSVMVGKLAKLGTCFNAIEELTCPEYVNGCSRSSVHKTSVLSLLGASSLACHTFMAGVAHEVWWIIAS